MFPDEGQKDVHSLNVILLFIGSIAQARIILTREKNLIQDIVALLVMSDGHIYVGKDIKGASPSSI